MAIPTFSIILPTFNRATLLAEAIMSVLDQDFQDFELLIIDDGSIDETASVVKEFIDARIKYHFQENRGKGAARNEGLKRCQGKHICFLDDDDLYKPNHLSTFDAYIKTHPGVEGILRTGVTSNLNGKNFQSQYFSGGNFSDQIAFVLCQYFCLLDLCIPQAIASSITFPNLRLWQDKYYILLLLSEYKLKQITTRTVEAREHNERSINRAYKDISIIKEQINALRSLRRKLSIDSSKVEKAFVKTEQHILSTHLYNALLYGGLMEGLNLTKMLLKDKNLDYATLNVLKTWTRYFF